VRIERGVRFFFDIGRQAIAADHDHRVKVVGQGPLRFALCRTKLD
jgi:hypothetical protein